MILKVLEITKNFPKEVKYTLGQDIKRDALQLVRTHRFEFKRGRDF